MRRHKRRRNLKAVREFTVPYMNVLKAFAYAGQDFTAALAWLRPLDFLVPDRAVSPEVYDMLKSKYQTMKDRAWSKSKHSYDFSIEEEKSHGIFPLYSLIVVEDIDDESPYDIRMLQKLLDSMLCVSLRRAVCTLLWQKVPPEKIEKILHEEDFRAPPIKWSKEEIGLFMRLFWMTGDMTDQSWRLYGEMQNIDKDNENQMNVVPIIRQTRGLTWHGGPTEDIDNYKTLELIKAHQINEMRFGGDRKLALLASKAALKTVIAIEDLGVYGVNLEENPMKDVELLVVAGQSGQRSGFMNMEEVDGDISDPKDVGSDKEDYLNQ